MIEYDFSPGNFLKDKLSVIATACIAIAIAAFMMCIMGVSTMGCIAVSIVLILALAIALANSYFKRRRFYDSLIDSINSSDIAMDVTRMVDEPHFLEGCITYDTIQASASLSNRDICFYQDELKANREFTELWIHEVKTPIAAMRLVLSKLHGQEPDILRKELERIEVAVERTLFYTRAISPTIDYDLREAKLIDIVRSALKKNANLLLERGVSPSLDIPDNCTVIADPTWVSFALGQIISNSAKYNSTEISFHAETVDENTSHGRTILSIADNGCGIPAKDVPRVFERGFIGENGRGLANATGMGLHFVALLSEKMGISTKLSSIEGQGTTVEFSFPHDRRIFIRIAEQTESQLDVALV